jgi:hypothetical protein
MYNNSNVQWFSQTLMTYKDKFYATNGYLRVSLSTNTEDFKFFNPPTINISISNNYQKSINLNIQNARDLLRGFKDVLKQLNGQELNLQRKYQKDTVIHFTFKVDPNNNTRIVVIEIRNNETDFTKVIIPLESVFESFANCIKEFTEEYMNICSQLFVQSIQSQSTQIIQQLPSLIKGISSQIISNTPATSAVSDLCAPELDEQEVKVEPETIKEAEATINDLDKFLGADMENICVPEIDSGKCESSEKLTEVNSIFVKHYLDGDLHNLETAVTNYALTPCPLISMASDIKEHLKSHINDENFTVLPGIDDDTLKSLAYITKLFPSALYQNHINFSEPLPASTNVYKYQVDSVKEENLNIAYDLFLFGIYIRTVRRLLENKLSDVNENKALFNMYIRCFSDAFVFSFLEKVDKSKISSIVLTRYKYYDSIGVFDYYKGLLVGCQCPEVTENDIVSAVDEATQKVIGISPFIEVIHDSMASEGRLRLPAKNTLSLEQIINELLPLEIAEKTGKDLKKEEVYNKLKETYQVGEDVLLIFSDKKKQKQIKKSTTVKTSNLERLIRSKFLDEVPEQYRSEFMKYIVEIGNNKFDLSTDKFPIDEFGDNVIKALYLWDPEADPVVAKNYKQYFIKVEEEMMERDLILAKIRLDVEKTEDSGSEWDFI